MMIKTTLFALLFASASCAEALESFPKFKIDLSKAPEERYVEVTEAFREETITSFRQFLTEVPDFALSFFSWTSWLWWAVQYEKY